MVDRFPPAPPAQVTGSRTPRQSSEVPVTPSGGPLEVPLPSSVYTGGSAGHKVSDTTPVESKNDSSEGAQDDEQFTGMKEEGGAMEMHGRVVTPASRAPVGKLVAASRSAALHDDSDDDF